jgi:hypothetical protein
LNKQRLEREKKENIIKFGKQKLGVHGQDLPQFASNESKQFDSRMRNSLDHLVKLKSALNQPRQDQTSVNWWQQQPTYNPSPRHSSLRTLHTMHRWHARPDPYTSNELTSSLPPEDPFKRDRLITHIRKDEFVPILPPNQIDRTNKALKMSGPKPMAEMNRFSSLQIIF